MTFFNPKLIKNREKLIREAPLKVSESVFFVVLWSYYYWIKIFNIIGYLFYDPKVFIVSFVVFLCVLSLSSSAKLALLLRFAMPASPVPHSPSVTAAVTLPIY